MIFLDLDGVKMSAIVYKYNGAKNGRPPILHRTIGIHVELSQEVKARGIRKRNGPRWSWVGIYLGNAR